MRDEFRYIMLSFPQGSIYKNSSLREKLCFTFTFATHDIGRCFVPQHDIARLMTLGDASFLSMTLPTHDIGKMFYFGRSRLILPRVPGFFVPDLAPTRFVR
ncbi:hypothetical protein CAL7102_05888 [Dulcicalothrix desertica PCC 7102]|nr:hypothetical protein CAL7102_05888 [Dulcicalothrix desertica PCC 7102]